MPKSKEIQGPQITDFLRSMQVNVISTNFCMPSRPILAFS